MMYISGRFIARTSNVDTIRSCVELLVRESNNVLSEKNFRIEHGLSRYFFDTSVKEFDALAFSPFVIGVIATICDIGVIEVRDGDLTVAAYCYERPFYNQYVLSKQTIERIKGV